MQVLNFLIEFQNAKVSVTLLKNDSTTDALPAFLKILGTNKETFALELFLVTIKGGGNLTARTFKNER